MNILQTQVFSQQIIVLDTLLFGGTCMEEISLRKHAYSNIYKISPPKNENFQKKKKKLRYFHISAKIIDCGYSLEPPRRGGSNGTQNLCF